MKYKDKKTFIITIKQKNQTNHGFYSPANVDEPNIWGEDENEVGESEHNSSCHHCTTATKPGL